MSGGPQAEAANPALHGATLLQAGQLETARQTLERAVAGRSGTDATAWSNLATARQRLGDRDGAVAAMRRAVQLAPDLADMRFNLASILLAAGEPGTAERTLREALARRPDHARCWNLLGLVLSRPGEDGGVPPARQAEAAAAFRRALRHDGGLAGAWQNLGKLLQARGGLHAALACFRQSLALQPLQPLVQVALSQLYRDLGRPRDALAAAAAAAKLAPGLPSAETALIFALDFDARQDTESQQQARRRWAARTASASLAPPSTPAAADPQRRLHVGYVSAEFNAHSAAATFAAPILHHDPAAVRVTCYYTVRWEDAFNRRFRAAAEGWRDVVGLSDAELAAQVRRDGVDILVDLSGHTPSHRLGLFALRPAPLQVSGWGHCTGTGLPQMDALLADPVLVPAAERSLFAERVLDLPCALSYLPFETPPPAVPAGGLPPRPGAPHEQGWPTFGALGRSAKLGPDCVALWARVLHAVSGSRLFLKDPHYAERGRRREVELAFAARGIDPSRLSFAGQTDWAEHMRAYWQVDIALDTMPAGGGVTTLEALWMGVPVVTLYGRFPSSRIGASVLTACGLQDWVAQDPDAFVAAARRLAENLPSLRAGRPALRERLRHCPTYDPDAYARAVEAAFRALWRDWCAGRRGAG